MSLKRSSVSDRSGIGYTSAIELKSGNNALGKDMIGVVGPDGGAGTVRVASAPMERHNKRITFAPDVTGEGIDDVDISNSKRNSLAKRNPSGSSSYATVIADLTAETTTSPSSNSSLTSASNNNNSSNNNNNTKLPTNIDDLQTLVTEQSQRIAELESKLKESEKREADALKQKIAAVKELETNKKFLVTDIKSNELLKTQLQEEHQTNASLIIFNRLKRILHPFFFNPNKVLI
ncbi:hypothetical protein BDR26DRAFT_873641 [Obelidium mucronatum]|nr:hypothetical protein BDR26DRAFT_873641 [Obelidium mucronatum]